MSALFRNEEVEKELKSEIEKIEKFEWKHRNAIFLVISLIATYYILTSDLPGLIIANAGANGYFGALVSGFFLSYGFTALPATASFLILADKFNPFYLAFFGSIGSIISDYIIYRFVKDKLLLEINSGMNFLSPRLKMKINFLRLKVQKSKILRKLVPIFAGILIATPLPDELSVGLIAIERYDVKKFMIEAFVLHFVGILLIAYASAFI